MQCPSCHIENKSDSTYCASCGAKLHEGDVGPRSNAGFWKRVGAAILDSIILSIVNVVLMAVVGGAAGASMIASGGEVNPAMLSGVFMVYGVSIVLNWLYFTVMESSSYQATLGKMALGLIVTDTAGQRISFARANGRYWSKILSSMILFIGFLMVAFTEKKQGLHDLIASTLVVDK